MFTVEDVFKINNKTVYSVNITDHPFRINHCYKFNYQGTISYCRVRGIERMMGAFDHLGSLNLYVTTMDDLWVFDNIEEPMSLSKIQLKILKNRNISKYRIIVVKQDQKINFIKF